MGQRIMVRVRKFEQAGEAYEAERAFLERVNEVVIAAAKNSLQSETNNTTLPPESPVPHPFKSQWRARGQ